MKEKKGKISGLRVAIVGDIKHSRVARSNIWGLKKLGAEVIVVGPPTLIPPGIEAMGVKVSFSLEEVIEEVDVLNILRIQLERQKRGLFPSIREYHRLFGLTMDKLDKAKKDVLIMHPGPINLGVELSPEVINDPRAVILEQVTNGVAVRMAVLYLLLGSSGTEGA
jgi:aspartate carbamoyltransferase catalytic subunit